MNMKTWCVSLGLGIVGAITACAEPHDDEASAPAVELATLDVADEGTSYNGWTQSVQLGMEICIYTPTGLEHRAPHGRHEAEQSNRLTSPPGVIDRLWSS
jgi:hypothetical protein